MAFNQIVAICCDWCDIIWFCSQFKRSRMDINSLKTPTFVRFLHLWDSKWSQFLLGNCILGKNCTICDAFYGSMPLVSDHQSSTNNPKHASAWFVFADAADNAMTVEIFVLHVEQNWSTPQNWFSCGAVKFFGANLQYLLACSDLGWFDTIEICFVTIYTLLWEVKN